MIPVLDSRAMRQADAEAIRGGVASEDLMENAARALCRTLRRVLPGASRVVVVCGPGNNGGDGFAAARLLALEGAGVEVFTLGDPSEGPRDAATNAARARALGLPLTSLRASSAPAALRRALSAADAAIDALFGTGLSRPLRGDAARAVAALNRSGRPVLAADVPSGLASDRGALIGPAVRARWTVALGAPKPCHVFPPAGDLCGAVSVADIGIPRRALERRAKRLWLAEAADVRGRLGERARSSHKADFGRLAVIAGSRGKTGAAILAARGALRGGAGLVTVLCAESLEPLIVAGLPEAMTSGLEESAGAVAAGAAGSALAALDDFDAAAVGPGLGQAPGTVRFLETLLGGAALPAVIDADALNAFRGRARWFARRRSATVLTPHPGEAGRLLGRSSRAIQADRLGAARELARRSGAVVVLKGADSLIAEPSGEVVVNPTGTPLLATAGSGDVLTGAIGALLAGGLSARDAALAGVWLHGAAGELLAGSLGDAGLLAHEVADAIPSARRALREPEKGRRKTEDGEERA